MSTETNTATYTIPEFRLDTLKAQLGSLNKRARKLGVPEIALEVTGHEDRDMGKRNAFGEHEPKWVRFLTIAVTGATPKFAGWEFVATVQHTENGNVMRSAPTFKGDLSAYRTAAPYCTHCNTARNRKDTFIVRHEEQGLKQLGRNCIKDFLGHEDPHMLASWAEIIAAAGDACGAADEWDGEDFGGSGASRRHPLMSFLTTVAALVERDGGFWSRAAIERTHTSRGTTAAEAFGYFFPKRAGEERVEPSGANKEFATAARGWVLDTFEAKPELSDFENNLLVMAKGETITDRDAGIAAFIVEAYRRELGHRVEREAKAKSEYVGMVGERQRNIELTVTRATPYESQFGGGVAYGFRDAAGNVFSLMTGAVSLNVGETFKADATVKAHEIYRDHKQTVLTRLKVKEVK